MRGQLRGSLHNLRRYIATVETTKHRTFQFLDQSILPDNKLIVIAVEQAWILGVLSSRVHGTWVSPDALGSRLGYGNDPVYVKSTCFETFPFPAATDKQKKRIGDLAEQIDAHRKTQLAENPKLTLTGLYNVMQKRCADEKLTPKEKTIHEQGLVAVLKDLHDELDAAVADAYGWPVDLSDAQILDNLLALNLEQASEERAGMIRWLRPDYQNPDGKDPSMQAEIAVAAQDEALKASKPRLPDDLPGRFAAIRLVLAELPEGGDTEAIAGQFKSAKRKTITEILETLVGLGQVSRGQAGIYRM